uniref:uncharacterized protein LOC120329855 n=1 Tax=Styela clava TaxID=7725 RepID=UPI0019395A4B|nr:uncharacterized protein LOC120329855 [Styela clava]
MCVCYSGYTGEHCNITQASTIKRRCVQCTSASGMNCEDFNQAEDCLNGESFCASTRTTLIDSFDNIVGKPLVTKGCTNDFIVADQCFFTDVFTDSPISDGGLYKEYTCVSICDTDGCNNFSADGQKYTNKTAPIQCFVCRDLTGSGQCNPGSLSDEKRTVCPKSTLCKSTVTYLVSSKTDVSYYTEPSYTLRSVIRECALAEETIPHSNCTPGEIRGLSLKKVNCVETCDVDGCNDKWPGRKKCIQCSSDGNLEGFSKCLLTPPTATACAYPYQKYCTIQDMGMTNTSEGLVGIPGYPTRILRGCSAINITNKCTNQTIRGNQIDYCNWTCDDTDGCNIGFTRQFTRKFTQQTSGVAVIHSSLDVVMLAILGVIGVM